VLTLIEEDPLAYKGSLRIGSAAAVLDLGSRCESTLESIRCPFLCMLAEREQVLGPMARAAAERMYEHAATPPSMKCLKRYDALHGLLCEPEPLRSLIVGDILAWLGERANARGVGRLRPMSREVSTRALAAEAAQLV
jgi:alpha-beta hydrolase superfamily lysophospholipase